MCVLNGGGALAAGTVAALQEGMQRLLETGSWTRYRWKNQAPLDRESFRWIIAHSTEERCSCAVAVD